MQSTTQRGEPLLQVEVGGFDWTSGMIRKVYAIENKVQDIANEHAGHYDEVIKKLDRMDQNMKRLAVMPAWQIHNLGAQGGGGDSNETELVRPPNLCRCPKNLYVLWYEFESSVGGNKPARLWSMFFYVLEKF